MIRYAFTFADGTRAVFEVDENTPPSRTPRSSEGLPACMDMDTHRCSACPMPKRARLVCPAFDAILPTIQAFDRRGSSETCELTVQQNGVTHLMSTSVQNAVRSLIGLQLALSGCPVMSRLRPMAQFHIPLSDADQTLFRVFGMYMLKQYLRLIKGGTPDWSLAQLQAFYDDVHLVNQQLAARIRAATQQDAVVNGLVILDVLGRAVQRDIQSHLERLAPRFETLFSVHKPTGFSTITARVPDSAAAN
jgi:hypothetical protein